MRRTFIGSDPYDLFGEGVLINCLERHGKMSGYVRKSDGNQEGGGGTLMRPIAEEFLCKENDDGS